MNTEVEKLAVQDIGDVSEGLPPVRVLAQEVQRLCATPEPVEQWFLGKPINPAHHRHGQIEADQCRIRCGQPREDEERPAAEGTDFEHRLGP